MKQIRIGTSPMTNTIYAGHVKSDGMWEDGKQIVTGEACGAVCEHVVANGGVMTITYADKPKYIITVESISDKQEQPK